MEPFSSVRRELRLRGQSLDGSFGKYLGLYAVVSPTSCTSLSPSTALTGQCTRTYGYVLGSWRAISWSLRGAITGFFAGCLTPAAGNRGYNCLGASISRWTLVTPAASIRRYNCFGASIVSSTRQKTKEIKIPRGTVFPKRTHTR